jgi:hypothetical protein
MLQFVIEENNILILSAANSCCMDYWQVCSKANQTRPGFLKNQAFSSRKELAKT